MEDITFQEGVRKEYKIINWDVYVSIGDYTAKQTYNVTIVFTNNLMVDCIPE